MARQKRYSKQGFQENENLSTELNRITTDENTGIINTGYAENVSSGSGQQLSVRNQEAQHIYQTQTGNITFQYTQSNIASNTTAIQKQQNLMKSSSFRRNYVNLDDTNGELIGRDSELKKLSEMLTEGGCIAIVGVGGQGKTALVYNYVRPHLKKSKRFKNIIWLTIEGTGTDLTKLAELLDIDASTNPYETAESIRDHLSVTPTLLILDNLETAIKDDNSLLLDMAALMQRLAEFRGTSEIIIATRQVPKPYRPKILALNGLTPDAGVQLLRKRGLLKERGLQLELATKKAQGNPFALKLLAGLVSDPLGGDSLDNLLEQGDLWDKELSEYLLRKVWDTRLNFDEQKLLKILSILRPPARRNALLNLSMPTTASQLLI
jgi:hypothetical protein